MRIFPRLKERKVYIPKRLWFTGMTIYPFVILTRYHSATTIDHERIHLGQQDKWWSILGPVGLILWFTLYLIVLPVGWNPFRWKWEREPYLKINGYTETQFETKMKKSPYFLWWH